MKVVLESRVRFALAVVCSLYKQIDVVQCMFHYDISRRCV